jgi:CRISPR-associated endonuclease Csn1
MSRLNPRRPYRLGLDVGSNSLGWFVVWLDANGKPCELGPGGVRIYPDGRDPQSKTSNAVSRRIARGARRRRDRYLRRRSTLVDMLITSGLMPADEAARKALERLDPYRLRAGALETSLPPHHVGRALFHIDQRRGFKSNRKTEKGDSESGAIKEGASKLEAAMEASGAVTLGQFLWGRHHVTGAEDRQSAIREELKRLGKDHLTGDKRKKAWAKARKKLFGDSVLEDAPTSVRARNISSGPKAEYDFYPTREMLEDEFDRIWVTQARHHPTIMNDVTRDAIRHAIFFQRALKTPPVGKCSLDPAQDADDIEGFRCPWADPRAQRFRIWQEVRNLEIVETGRKNRRLTKEDGNNIATILINDGKPGLTKDGKLSFGKIRNILGLPEEARFNLESEKRDHLLGDLTAAKLSGKNFFGKAWRDLPPARQIEIIDRLTNEPDLPVLISWLTENAGLNNEAAEHTANAFLPDGHSRLGLRAIAKITPFMIEGKNYPDAAKAAGYDHAKLPDGVVFDFLPYYGARLQDDVVGSGDPKDADEKRWGRVPNPTVHIGLGQIRRVVNALINKYGPPAEINIEMTRDFKLSPRKLAEVEAEQAKNQRKNNARREELRKLGQAENNRNLTKMRLWEELNVKDPLDRCCPFTGEKISIQRLLSDEVEIEHLIPFSSSLDDSAVNKVVSMRYANRAKSNMTPYEAFGTSPSIDGHQYDWEKISAVAAGLPHSKRRRFSPDAREQFGTEERFLARQLNETGWLAKMAKDYLSSVTGPYKTLVLPGKMTALLRRKWGIHDRLPDHNYSDAKNRKDHRHHAIDAVVAALTDPSLLQRMASTYDEERDRIVLEPPWPTLRDDLDRRLDAMIVAHKTEHGVSGQLHEDTAFGSVTNEDGGNLVYRKPLQSLTDKEIERIRDPGLRKLVKDHVRGEMAQGRELKHALSSFAHAAKPPLARHGVRHVRLTKSEKPDYLVAVNDRTGKAYKYYSAGENAYVDIVEAPDGKWLAHVTNTFNANQARTAANPFKLPAGFVMRVFKGDLIAVNSDKSRTIMVVHRLDAANSRFKLAAHNEAGNLDRRHADPDDPFRWLMASYNTLKSLNAHKVRVDELGTVWREHPDDVARKLSRQTG